jgi:hypothetical protein
MVASSGTWKATIPRRADAATAASSSGTTSTTGVEQINTYFNYSYPQLKFNP